MFLRYREWDKRTEFAFVIVTQMKENKTSGQSESNKGTTSVRETLEMCFLENCEVTKDWLYFQNPFVWREGQTHWEQQDTQLAECCCVSAADPLIRGQPECVINMFHSQLIPSVLSAVHYRSDRIISPELKACTHTHIKLANVMQQHVWHTSLPYSVWCNHSNSWAGGCCPQFIDR